VFLKVNFLSRQKKRRLVSNRIESTGGPVDFGAISSFICVAAEYRRALDNRPRPRSSQDHDQDQDHWLGQRLAFGSFDITTTMSHHDHNSQTGFPLAAKTGCSHLVKFHFFLLFARWPRLLQQLFMKIKAIPYQTIPSSHLWTRVSAKFGVHQLCIVNCKRHCHCQSMF